MDYAVDDFIKLERDRFILSKGHSAPALYAIAAKVGILSEDRLNGLRKINMTKICWNGSIRDLKKQ